MTTSKPGRPRGRPQKAPLGLCQIPGGWATDHHWVTIRLLWSQKRKGRSLGQLAEWLNNRLPSEYCGRVSRQSVDRILKDKRYGPFLNPGEQVVPARSLPHNSLLRCLFCNSPLVKTTYSSARKHRLMCAKRKEGGVESCRYPPVDLFSRGFVIHLMNKWESQNPNIPFPLDALWGKPKRLSGLEAIMAQQIISETEEKLTKSERIKLMQKLARTYMVVADSSTPSNRTKIVVRKSNIADGFFTEDQCRLIRGGWRPTASR